jgi:hypothetical protein
LIIQIDILHYVPLSALVNIFGGIVSADKEANLRDQGRIPGINYKKKQMFVSRAELGALIRKRSKSL